MQGGVGEVDLDPLESLLKLMETIADEGYRTGHFAVNTPSINTDRNVPLFFSFFHKHLNILSLTAPRHPMHNNHNRPISLLLLLIQPIQRQMSTICEKYSLPLQRQEDVGRP
jgi:hypothetical protein